MSILGLFGCGWMIAGLLRHDMDMFHVGLITVCVGLCLGFNVRTKNDI